MSAFPIRIPTFGRIDLNRRNLPIARFLINAFPFASV